MSSTPNLRRDHALHNEEVSDFLATRPEFADWVVTTAFYSALHWIKYSIFPLSVTLDDGTIQVFPDLGAYQRLAFGKQMPSESPHKTLLRLAKTCCPTSVSAEYKRLYSICMTARYEDYRLAPPIIAVAREGLKVIRRHCDQPK
jgi:hypothetical protein